MRVMNIEDVRCPEAIQDAYITSKYIERQGIEIDEFTIGNCHDAIEEAVDDHNLPITQVVIERDYLIGDTPAPDIIEGYLIGV